MEQKVVGEMEIEVTKGEERTEYEKCSHAELWSGLIVILIIIVMFLLRRALVAKAISD